MLFCIATIMRCLRIPVTEYASPVCALVMPRMRLFRPNILRYGRRANGIHRGDRPLSVLVTGATGFLGRALVARLLADGHVVSGVARTGAHAADDLRMFLGDLRSVDFVKD